MTACRDGERLNPYEIVAALREQTVAAAGWRERATTLGIGELELNPPDEGEQAQAARAGSHKGEARHPEQSEGPGSTPGAFAQLAGREPPMAD